MGDFPASLLDDREFIVTLARFADGLISEAVIRKKYGFDDQVWESLGSNDALCERIQAEAARRIADGSTARERAQMHFATAPNVLGGILQDNNANARHRIESAKELRAIATPPSEAAAAADRFIITINLGGDVVEHYNKSRAIDANDVDPNDTDTTMLAIVAANKQGNDGGGQPI
jgi:hypothetical protein